jgi:hypothetical protein
LAKKAFIKQAMINAADIDYNHVCCPECGNDHTLIISGYTMIPREEVFQQGELIEIKSFDEQAAFKVEQIYCLVCQTKNILQDPTNFQLQKANLQLNTKIRELSGEDPMSLGAVN